MLISAEIDILSTFVLFADVEWMLFDGNIWISSTNQRIMLSQHGFVKIWKPFIEIGFAGFWTNHGTKIDVSPRLFGVGRAAAA